VATYNAALAFTGQTGTATENLQNETTHLVRMALSQCTPYKLTHNIATGELYSVVFNPASKAEWTLVFGKL
jgi:hypothetical protein